MVRRATSNRAQIIPNAQLTVTQQTQRAALGTPLTKNGPMEPALILLDPFNPPHFRFLVLGMENYSTAQGHQNVPAPLTVTWSLAACTVCEAPGGWHDQAALSEATVVGEQDRSIKWESGRRCRWQPNEEGGTGQGGPQGGTPSTELAVCSGRVCRQS